MAAHHAICAVAFLDSVSRMGARNLLDAWLHDLAFMAPEEGWGELYESDAFQRCADASALELRAILTEARGRVASELGAWIADPRADALLRRLMDEGALRQRSSGAWSPRVSARPRLSDLVLSLFAADIGDRRALYESKLCVCKVCGRVSFDPSVGERTGCVEHPDVIARYERQLRGWRTGPVTASRFSR
ncbi:MAG: hypothetical protein U0414_34360 [Polyangiaceae bacterium]